MRSKNPFVVERNPVPLNVVKGGYGSRAQAAASALLSMNIGDRVVTQNAKDYHVFQYAIKKLGAKCKTTCIDGTKWDQSDKKVAFYLTQKPKRAKRSKLSEQQIEEIKKDGLYNVGPNVYFQLDKGRRSWIFRYRSPVTGKDRHMGLGALSEVTLAEALEKAVEYKKMLRNGLDPLVWAMRKKDPARKRPQLSAKQLRELAEPRY